MADQPRTQKQIAQKYKDNLDYYRRGHFLRRLKLICFLLAVVGSIGAVLGFRYWGTKEYFSTGPLSQNHARFAKDCAACHDGAEADLSRALKLDQAMTDLKEGNLPTVDLEKLKAAAGRGAKMLSPEELKAAAERNFSPEKLSALSQVVIKKSSLTGMDRACLKCHEPYKLHQPQKEAIDLRGVHPEMPLVHADRCSTCHREHIGHDAMKLPGGETCASCHADLQEMQRTRSVVKINSPSPPTKPENRRLQSGLIGFIMPQDALPKPAPILSYAEGHPPFHYEGSTARDPAVIKYNHRRHEQADIPKVAGHALNCTDCHQPAADGVYYQRVKFEQHCAKCHALHLNPELSGLVIPHGSSDVVRAFLRTLNTQYVTYFMKEKGIVDREQLGTLLTAQFDVLRARGMSGPNAGDELERRVFYTGDPPRAEERISPSSRAPQYFPPCAKCHEVSGGNAAAPPKVAVTNIADRWVHHGPFTHLPHRHMSCQDCHGAAHRSEKTTDILLPSQKLCAECHRPLQKDKMLEVTNGGVAAHPGTPQMATVQRREGGVKWDCQHCHHFHAAPEAIQYLEKSTKSASK